jgi:hypothetical protein
MLLGAQMFLEEIINTLNQKTSLHIGQPYIKIKQPQNYQLIHGSITIKNKLQQLPLPIMKLGHNNQEAHIMTKLLGLKLLLHQCTPDNTSGLTLINSNALTNSTNNSIPGNKELASLQEDFLNLLLDTVLEDHPSLSSVELVEVSTQKLLMSVPILSVKSSRILKKMILPTQELLPITLVIT